jgi:methyl-accepting chemotaxis protein
LAVLPLIDELAENVSVLVPRITEQIRKFTSAWQSLSPAVQKTTLITIGFVAILGPLLIGISFVIKSLILLSRVFVILASSILRIPLAIALLIGLFAAQSDAQYKLAKETGDSWGMITRVFVMGVKTMLFAIDRVIDGFKFIGFVLDYASARFDNFINIITFKGGKSMMRFEDQLNSFKFSNLAGGLDSAVASFNEFSNEISSASSESKILANDAKKLAEETEDLTKGLNKNTDALKKVKEAAKDAAQVIVDNLEESLRKAESGLDDVKGKFESFRDAITGTITGILNFGKAAESENFLQGLADQAQNATDFANKVKQLVVLGLNERGIRQVLDAGFEAGGQIADEIIAGGATVVQQVNTLVDSIFGVAEQVGEFGAVAFYDAGVKQAEAMVAGIKAALESARADLKLIVDGLATGGTTTGAGPSATDPAPSAEKLKQDNIRKPILTNKQIATISKLPDAATRHYTALATALNNKTIKLAKGGIVTGPTNALIGEAGPEAVIPLSGANSMSMGSNYYITVNAGIGTSGSQVGREIVDAIKKFEKTSGPVFASA